MLVILSGLLLVIFATVSCKRESTIVNPPARPAITSVTPTTDTIGQTITITGTDFTGGTVKVGGIVATVIGAVTATSITAKVPPGVVPGSATVVVTTTGGASAAFNITIIGTGGGPAPTISAVAPVTDTIGQTITITGTNFTGATVTVGTLAATNVVVVNPTSITAKIPVGVPLGAATVIVVTGGGPATFGITIIATGGTGPTITAVTPASGTVGQAITITGTNLTGATVTVGGIAATNVVVVGPTSITANIPAGVPAGAATIIVTTGAGSANVAFTVNARDRKSTRLNSSHSS